MSLSICGNCQRKYDIIIEFGDDMSHQNCSICGENPGYDCYEKVSTKTILIALIKRSNKPEVK